MQNRLWEAGKLYGECIYDGLTDQQQGIIAFGMTPVELANDAEEYGKTMLAKSYAAYHWNDESQWKSAYDNMQKNATSDFVKGFCSGLMSAAKKKGRMIA